MFGPAFGFWVCRLGLVSLQASAGDADDAGYAGDVGLAVVAAAAVGC